MSRIIVRSETFQTTLVYSNLIFGQPFWSGHFLFLNVEFTDSSIKISRTVKKVPSESSKFNNYLHFGPPHLICHLLFSNCKLRFVISDVKNF